MRKIVKMVGEKMVGDDGKEFAFCVVAQNGKYYAATTDDLNPHGTISCGAAAHATADAAEKDALAQVADYQ